jgi:HTH-type transcriptional regulator/antitoxin HigA
MQTLNAEKYASLVHQYNFAPSMIGSERDYRRARGTVERLLFPERRLSPEEGALANLLLHLIDVYESSVTEPPLSTPRDVLKHLMEQRQLKQADLIGVLGTASVVSEILSGKRSINSRQARGLADYFGIGADLFL